MVRISQQNNEYREIYACTKIQAPMESTNKFDARKKTLGSFMYIFRGCRCALS